jgi:F-type H+-transporting ATPase subunit epsilon
MASIHLKVVSPRTTIFEGEVAHCTAPGATGEFGVLPEHISYLTSIVPGPLRFEHEGTRYVYALGKGFIQVVGDDVTVLTQFADTQDSLDRSALLEELTAAETAFVELGPSDRGYAPAWNRVLNARARLATLEV